MARSRFRVLWQALLGALLALPLGCLAWLLLHPAHDRLYMIPMEHFYVVSATALAALCLALLVSVASLQTRNPRTFFVATGFLAIAGIFSVHGLTTPGDQTLVKEFHNVILISARLSLLAGGICFWLSTVSLPQRVEAALSRHYGRWLLAAVIAIGAYIGINLAHPALFDAVPMGNAPAQPAMSHTSSSGSGTYGIGLLAGYGPSAPASDTPSRDNGWQTIAGRVISYGMAIIAALGFAIAAWRDARVYALSRLPATGTLAIGMVLLAESQISMTLGHTWHLSWWLYHGLMLVGFLVPIGGLGIAYARGSSLREIVDGFFLRDTVSWIERSLPDALNALIAAIEAKDPSLRGHHWRVYHLATAIATELGLPEVKLRATGYGALLHDVGKIAIPDAVLQKAGRLADEEYAVLREHPIHGERIALHAPSLRQAAPAIRWHHERLDGSGYPDGLRGEQIPLEARIVAVADVWDALTSDRVYRQAMTPAAAREILQREAGTKLDVQCVAALFATLEREAGGSPARIPSPVAHDHAWVAAAS